MGDIDSVEYKARKGSFVGIVLKSIKRIRGKTEIYGKNYPGK
jgi:hypothetical protein